jgi:hypothetical protein
MEIAYHYVMKMAINPKDVEVVQKLLWNGENIELTARQRRIGPGGSVTTPTSIIVTNMRLIVVNREALGIRKDYEVIPYKDIASVRLEKGIIASSVFVRVLGYDRDKGLLKNGTEEGEIGGLNNTDAQAISDNIEKKISGTYAPSEASGISPDIDAKLGAYIFCSNCGAKDAASAHFCKKCGSKLE